MGDVRFYIGDIEYVTVDRAAWTLAIGRTRLNALVSAGRIAPFVRSPDVRCPLIPMATVVELSRDLDAVRLSGMPVSHKLKGPTESVRSVAAKLGCTKELAMSLIAKGRKDLPKAPNAEDHGPRGVIMWRAATMRPWIASAKAWLTRSTAGS